jgi:hypothetical protein
MRNLLIGLTFLFSFVISIVKEPIDDVVDAFAGGTNTTYDLTVDEIAGVSIDEDDEDEHEDEDDD